LISTADFRNGLSIIVDGEIFIIIEFQHVKPGKGGAFVRTKLRNLRTGNVFDRTFRAGEKMEQAILDKREMQYLYQDGDHYYFMDNESYDQISLTADQLGEGVKYLKDNQPVAVVMHQGQVIGAELPASVELKVASTDPGLKGDTASGGSKPATVETGAVVRVPLVIDPGDVIRVDTRTGEYLERC